MFNKYDLIRLLVAAVCIMCVYNSIGDKPIDWSLADSRVVDFSTGSK